MNGQNKAFLKVGGRTILARLLDTLQLNFEELLLVTREPQCYAQFPVQVVVDLYQDRSSLTGIHAGLINARANYALVVPCDTPLLQPAVIRLLIDALDPQWDVIVPHMDGFYQPLCAIYSKQCLPVIETQLRNKNYRIYDFFPRVRVKIVPADQIKAADPQLLSFFNINTPSAHIACQEMLRQ
jgi:molybdopterin-guanine dinucleotide biosynthesis protein A